MRLSASILGLLSILVACSKDLVEDSGEVSDSGEHSPEEDCGDGDPSVHPGADEQCDGVDNDCDGLVDEGALLTFYEDKDGDGYGDSGAPIEACEAPEGSAASGEDCDDSSAVVYPGAPEEDCTDPVDYNCDGRVQYADADGDGSAACEDCDDSDAAVYPGAEELCDGVDNDCDGEGEVFFPGDYESLQDAVDAGEEYICVAAGEHEVNLDLTGVDTLTIEGVGGSEQVVLDGQGSRVVDMGIGAHAVTLKGLTLENVAASGQDGLGVMATDCTDITLQDIVVREVSGDGANQTGLAIGFRACDGVQVHDSAVHSATAAYSAGADTSYGLVGFSVCDNVEVDGLEVYDSSVTGFDSILGGALCFYSTTGSVIRVNDVSVHDYEESSTRLGYGTILAMNASHVEASNLNVYDTVRESVNATGSVFFFQTRGDLTVNNVRIVGNTTRSTGYQQGPQFWEMATWGDVRISNLISAGNTNTSTGTTYSGSVYFSNYRATSYVVSNVSVYGNTATHKLDEGGGMLACSGPMSIHNATVSGNSVNGGAEPAGFGSPSSQTPCQLSAFHNNVYDNGVDFSGIADFIGSDGNISVDPGFVDVSSADPTLWDLHLGQSSALIDAGDATLLDADGSTSDLGAYGGPLGESWAF